MRSEDLSRASEDLVTIASFNLAAEAHFARGLLEAEGIDAVVIDENLTTLNPLLTGAIGGVRLQVRESDAERAMQVLGQAEAGQRLEIPMAEIVCPRCGSSQVYFEKFNRRRSKLMWLFLGIPIPFLKRKWKCRNCGHEWKMRNRKHYRAS